MKEFIIGRTGNQPFDIKSEAVHGEHVRITISDQGIWTLEDLKGDNGNGTYVKEEDGSFRKVYKMQITENTIIRLAKGGHKSYTFMAHRLLAKQNDYSYEFQIMRQHYHALKTEEEKQEQTNMKHVRMAKWAPIIGIALSFATEIPVLKETFTTEVKFYFVRGAIVVPTFLTGQLFANDVPKLKAIRQRKLSVTICPRCGRPLSDFDVNNMQCSVCGAR